MEIMTKADSVNELYNDALTAFGDGDFIRLEAVMLQLRAADYDCWEYLKDLLADSIMSMGDLVYDES